MQRQDEDLTAHQLLQRALNLVHELEQRKAITPAEATGCRSSTRARGGDGRLDDPARRVHHSRC
jgi:hypothetical protein